MTWNALIPIIAVPILTGAFALAIVWHVRSTMSQDPRVRHRAWVVEILMSLGVFTLSVVTSRPTPKQWYIYLATIGILSALWLFRGARLLLGKRKRA